MSTTSTNPSNDCQVGSGEFTYLADPTWHRLPADWVVNEVTAVATDSRDRVFVFNRSEHPVIVFDAEGNFLESWGEGVFARPHGITIGPDDSVYCTDDLDHTVRKFDADGRLRMTLGTSGVYSDTGATSVDYRHVRRSAGPFNFPTNVALAADGCLYVSDGYGNARIHKFSPEGELLLSWGEPGRGPGQFHVPHGLAIAPDGTIFVADRENSRLQLFSPTGKWLETWTDVARPCQVFIDPAGRVFVAELGWLSGLFPGDHPPANVDIVGGRVSVFARDGKRLARWGGGSRPCEAGDFFAPHDIWLDSQGSIYVSEVTYTAGIQRGVIGPDCHTLQKFNRVGVAR